MLSPELFRESPNGVTFRVKVVPRATREEIVGVEGEAIKIRLQAPPVEGRANEALVKFLAKLLRVPRAHIEILHGASARDKVIRVRGASLEHVKRVLAP